MKTSEMNQHEFFDFIFSLNNFSEFTKNQKVTLQRFMNDNFDKFCTSEINLNGEYGFSFGKVSQFLNDVTPAILDDIENNYI